MPLSTYNPDGYVVKVSEAALAQICLNGLEAYVIGGNGPKGRTNLLETYGLLWGHEVSLPDGKTLYSIEFMSVDTSAATTRNSFLPNPSALHMKTDIISSFWPQYEFIGDFHTHPYSDPTTRS